LAGRRRGASQREQQKGKQTLHTDTQAHKKEGTLYVVATPIGNLRDITLRAIETLKSVNIVAAEDTRNTNHLLAHYAIATPQMALHEHNERQATEKILALLADGKSVALVSDAGTPAISDPGAILVRCVREAGFRVEPIPGPNAAIAALSASGSDTPHFLFYGFLPSKASARKQALKGLSSLPYDLVFYESPHRIQECVRDIAEIMGIHRKITFARELTKLFESIHSCALAEAQGWLEQDANHRKGEFVLVVEGCQEQQDVREADKERIMKILASELPLKQAAKLGAEILGVKKGELYDLGLRQKSK
jgi:16S rRNA (cytidine1402-2'-O)-methyltransferase